MSEAEAERKEDAALIESKT